MSAGFEIAIIGGGIVGVATGMALAPRSKSLVILEAEKDLAQHQTGRNSGVIHSGLYYKPGSWKARLCVEGREAMYRFCEENGLPHERCGKLVVAITPEEEKLLQALAERGRANGIEGLRQLSPEEIREREPEVHARAGLLVPVTGIVDFVAVTRAFAERVRAAGGEIRCSARVCGIARDSDGLVLETTAGPIRARNLINCAGLQCDRIARLCGLRPEAKIVPFRGEYYVLRPEKSGFIRHLVYPVPDPRFPFLGVHFTRMIHGGIEAGPNAVLAFKREGYTKTSFSLRDTVETFMWPGALRLFARHWRMGLEEFHRSFSKKAFVRALQRLTPAIRAEDLEPGEAGVRAQAVARDGSLVDDFLFLEAERMIHVLNAPSPAATASIAIGRVIAERAIKNFGLS